ncbi:MAG: DUF1015 domain-containing protein [Sedimentisphaerales bacterium]|nr:DUF1015 domain-containing protein [Sedimentisphaerales bacterium]
MRMEVKPFKALRFDGRVVGNVGDCIAPPYDVIDAAQQEQLYKKSPYNVVRITRGKTLSCDDGEHNQYTRAAEYLTQWMREGALKLDARESVYGYVQDFALDGIAFQRLTFIALGKLEDFGKTVRPHEQVFAKPMQDRLNLKRATAARFGLVFMLYDDPEQVADAIILKAATQTPLVDFVDEQNVRHRLFAIEAADDIQAIVRMMRDKSVIIADGHHRYTTGLTYWRETGNPAAGYQMLAFTNTRQPGLVVLATHRVVGGIQGFQPQALLEQLKGKFDVVEFAFGRAGKSKEQARQGMLAEMKTLGTKDASVVGIYMGDSAFYVAILKDEQHMAAAAPQMSSAWRTLDVSVLQKLVMEELLGFDAETMGNPDRVAYVKDMPNAISDIIARVDAGEKQIAFLTNPVRMPQLVDVTDAGERMPHKSTYFYPKMYTGLTIQKL